MELRSQIVGVAQDNYVREMLFRARVCLTNAQTEPKNLECIDIQLNIFNCYFVVTQLKETKIV